MLHAACKHLEPEQCVHRCQPGQLLSGFQSIHLRGSLWRSVWAVFHGSAQQGGCRSTGRPLPGQALSAACMQLWHCPTCSCSRLVQQSLAAPVWRARSVKCCCRSSYVQRSSWSALLWASSFSSRSCRCGAHPMLDCSCKPVPSARHTSRHACSDWEAVKTAVSFWVQECTVSQHLSRALLMTLMVVCRRPTSRQRAGAEQAWVACRSVQHASHISTQPLEPGLCTPLAAAVAHAHHTCTPVLTQAAHADCSCGAPGWGSGWRPARSCAVAHSCSQLTCCCAAGMPARKYKHSFLRIAD